MPTDFQDKRFFPLPPMTHEDVTAVLETTTPADRMRSHVPAYSFGIYDLGRKVRYGRISFRIGDTEQIVMYSGHIGFGIEKRHTGHGYAAKACLAIRPLIGRCYDSVIITCDPENAASRRTIEKIGGIFIEQVPVPRDNPLFIRDGSTAKNRYVWEVRPLCRPVVD